MKTRDRAELLRAASGFEKFFFCSSPHWELIRPSPNF
jgi:hypothetical protein